MSEYCERPVDARNSGEVVADDNRTVGIADPERADGGGDAFWRWQCAHCAARPGSHPASSGKIGLSTAVGIPAGMAAQKLASGEAAA
jgi:hypothetical protein